MYFGHEIFFFWNGWDGGSQIFSTNVPWTLKSVKKIKMHFPLILGN